MNRDYGVEMKTKDEQRDLLVDELANNVGQMKAVAINLHEQGKKNDMQINQMSKENAKLQEKLPTTMDKLNHFVMVQSDWSIYVALMILTALLFLLIFL